MPRTAASASTLVVSWKEAAEIQLSVVNDALVIPRSMGSPVAAFLPWAIISSFLSSKTHFSTCSPMRKSVSPGSTTLMRLSIWRTMTSMCLSLIFTPWRR